MIERPITILHVLPKLDTGGAERVVIEISEAIHATGHKPLIACAGGPLSAVARRAGAEIIEMPLDTKSPFKMRRNAQRLKKLIAERDVQLVHAHSRARPGPPGGQRRPPARPSSPPIMAAMAKNPR